MLEKKLKPLRDHKLPAAHWQPAREIAQWLKAAPWQVFATFTFGGRPSDEEAEHHFGTYINRLESIFKADISYVRGHEMRFSGCGKPACGRHFHAVIASAACLRPAILEFFWASIPGNRSDSAKVLPYDPKRNGLSYVLKLINQPHGDWSFRKLHLVLPGITAKALNHRDRRNLRRHQERVKAFASMEQHVLMPGGPNPSPATFTMSGQQFSWCSYLKS